MKKYEVVFILDERQIEGTGEQFLKDVEAIIVNLGGKMVGREDFGRRQFSYPIKKRVSGHYWIVNMELDEQKVTEFRQRFVHDERILRMMILNHPPVTTAKR